MSWSAYYTLDEIYDWFDELAATYPDKITVVEGGSSYEGRKIKGAILATNPVRHVIQFERLKCQIYNNTTVSEQPRRVYRERNACS